MADMDALVAETEAKIAALKLRLPELEGKANKKERTQVNKDIYNLENDENYVAALKAKMSGARAEAAAADDAAHAAKLAAEMEEEKARELAAIKAAEEKKAAKAAGAVDIGDGDEEVHMEIKRLKKGDGETIPAVGDKVALTYHGTFADGTWDSTGEDWSGKVFDSTLRKKGKGKAAQEPLQFKLGEGKASKPRQPPPLALPTLLITAESKIPLLLFFAPRLAVRAWEEAVKTMTLGEKIELTAFPKWAYRKAGLQDDNGKNIVPPNTTLKFEMRLVQVRDKTVPAE